MIFSIVDQYFPSRGPTGERSTRCASPSIAIGSAALALADGAGDWEVAIVL